MRVTKMRYVEVTAPHQVRMCEGPIPQPGEGEVLVRVRVCGVDWPTFREVIEGQNTRYPANGFTNLGLAHEGSGEVVAVGPGVTRFQPGNRVSYLGPGFQEYAVVGQEFCGALPDRVDYLEPMAVMHHSAGKVHLDKTATLTVFGCGYMGLGLIHLLSRRGYDRMIAVDTNPLRLDHAKRMGAKWVIHAGNEDVSAAIAQWTHGTGADLAIEATGSAGVLDRIHEAVRPGGTVLVHGWFGGRRQVVLENWHVRDLTFHFSHPAPHEIYGRLIEEVAAELAAGRIHLTPLITHRMRLDDVPRLEEIVRSSTDYIKGVVEVEA